MYYLISVLVNSQSRFYISHSNIAILYLVSTEYGYNFQTVTTERVHVNATSPVGLDVEFDITLPSIPCNLLNIDANDPSGQTQSLHLDRRHHIWKHRVKVDENGKIQDIGSGLKLEQGSTLLHEDHLHEHLESLLKDSKDDEEEDEDCGSCYGAGEESECCNTCDDVKRAYNRKGWHIADMKAISQCKNEKQTENGEGEGCNVHGLVALDSGGGSFHLAPGRSMDVSGDPGSIFEVLLRTFEQFNVTHIVHKIRFGKEYPGHIQQLDGESRVIEDGYGMYQYYFKVRETNFSSSSR
jgi:hypothetical protein